jgi:CheY-like chemotaxis protein
MTQPIRSLIVDDNARSRRGLRALLGTVRLDSLVVPGADTLSKARFEVEVVGEATNGQEALNQMAECLPDVVLMDVRMPEMDGVEATRRIKSRWPDVKIVVLTLYTGNKSEALAAGADAFLVKGCTNKELFAAILNGEETQFVHG